jgi:hypothetical protein
MGSSDASQESSEKILNEFFEREGNLSGLDLNVFVEELLQVRQEKKEKKVVDSNKRRNRKNRDQVQILIKEYEINPNWTKKYICNLATISGLSEA